MRRPMSISSLVVVLAAEMLSSVLADQSRYVHRRHRHTGRPFNSRLYGGRWHNAAPLIYGYSVYVQHDSGRLEHGDWQPTICSNVYDLPLRLAGNVSNNISTTTVSSPGSADDDDDDDNYYEWFICPNATQSSDYNHCCGALDRQTCCRYWDDAGRVAVVVVAIAVFILFVIIIVVIVHRNKNSLSSTGSRLAESLRAAQTGSLLNRS